jgi:hypothetical protein
MVWYLITYRNNFTFIFPCFWRICVSVKMQKRILLHTAHCMKLIFIKLHKIIFITSNHNQ